MLGKLIKYDLKALVKILGPLWGVLLVMGLIFGMGMSDLSPIGNGMMVFSLVVIFAVIVGIFVISVIIIIQRFWKGLLKEEGYLMFTLPVTTRSLILAKAISAMLVSLGTALVITLLGVEIIAIKPCKTYGHRNILWKLGHRSTCGTMIGYGVGDRSRRFAKWNLSYIRSNGDRTVE